MMFTLDYEIHYQSFSYNYYREVFVSGFIIENGDPKSINHDSAEFIERECS